MAVCARSRKVWQSRAAPDRARLSYAEYYSQRRTARQKLLDRDVYSSVPGRRGGEVDARALSRILRLALLAPDIVEAALGGWADQGVMLERSERLRPLGSEEQRAALGRGQPRDSESGWSAALCLLAQRR